MFNLIRPSLDFHGKDLNLIEWTRVFRNLVVLKSYLSTVYTDQLTVTDETWSNLINLKNIKIQKERKCWLSYRLSDD